MFKRITPQTIADWGERIYIRFLELTKRFTSTQIMALLAIIVGVLAGLGTCLFELLLYGIKAGLTHWFPVEQSHFLFLFYPVIGIILASLFVKYVVKDNISEGVTRVLYAMSRKNSYIASHNCWTSVVGGATTIGFGGSVGPEAPIVLTGAAIGSNISRLAHLNYKNTTLLLCCGAGAALAAIFKAPITGVVFVLEILMLDLTSRTVVPLLISSITAAALTIRGFDPIIAISLTPDDAFRLNQIPLFVLLGIFCGLMSYYFTTVNARVGAFFKKIDSPYKKWLIGGAVLGILIYIFPPLYGEGYEGFMSLMHGNTTELFNNSLFYRFSQIDWVVILFIVGTMFFKVIAMASTNALFGWNLSLVSFTLVGMAGVMSGVMKAPLTSIFLIAELSSGYGLFIPLMITACIAFAIDYYLDPDSIYTKQLRQNGELITHNKDESVFVFLRLDDLIQDDGVYIHPSQTLGDIVQIMSRERHDDYFPVLDNEKHLLGIVRLNDVREDLFNPQKYGNPITRYMLLSPDTILQHEQIQSVLRRFDENHVWVLPVVDKEKHYLGYISKSRIMTAYREQLVKISQ